MPSPNAAMPTADHDHTDGVGVALTPQERLAQSRLALLDALLPPPPNPRSPSSGAGVARPARKAAARGASLLRKLPWLDMGRNMARRWWQRHPLHAAGQLAHPLLQGYASRNPAKLMAGAAAAGSLLALTRPWRLLSGTALLALLLRTSDVADLISTLAMSRLEPEPPPRKEMP